MMTDLEQKFFSNEEITPKAIIEKIETLHLRGMSYMDACLDLTTNDGIEMEVVVKALTPTLRDKIQAEAEELNFIQKTDKLFE